MKLSTISILISTITTQIELTRPDDTTAIISATPGCYCIQPSIQIITSADGFSFEFYDNWSCSGVKINETERVTGFYKPVQVYSVKVIKNEDENEDEDSEYMLYREGRGVEKCKNSVEIGKVDESIDSDEEYDDDLDISKYEPHKNYALATAPNNGFGTWNMDSYKISKKAAKKEAQALYNDEDGDESWEFDDDEFADE